MSVFNFILAIVTLILINHWVREYLKSVRKRQLNQIEMDTSSIKLELDKLKLDKEILKSNVKELEKEKQELLYENSQMKKKVQELLDKLTTLVKE